MYKKHGYKFHFHPKQGWCNDPNGLIFAEGKYHLFYQHYPDDTVWGPMHWGHAISSDLTTWEDMPIALYPDELGYIFSGSCIIDEDNVSGFGTLENPAMLAFFTHHNPDSGEQQQSLAYSLDYVNFTKYQENPVIKNKKTDSSFRVDFRDPKVVKNTVIGGYTMVLSGGREIVFYHSDNLIEWELTGSFDPGEFGFEGICECPDLMGFDTSEGKKWVLVISSILPPQKIGTDLRKGFSPVEKVMQYFVGNFDGKTFASDEQMEPKILDYGPDNYAMVSFANVQEKLLMGWGECWEYVRDTPVHSYRGKMTLPRIAYLKKIGDEYFLCFKPAVSVDTKKLQMTDHGRIDLSDTISISLVGNEVSVCRNRENCLKLSDAFKNEALVCQTVRRRMNGPCNIEVIQDCDYFEIFIDDGAFVISVMDY